MSLLNYFKFNRTLNTAQTAKERLQIIVAHERVQRKSKNGSINLHELQQKLIGVISEYLQIDQTQVMVELQRDENRSVLELNVTLPDRVDALEA